MEDRLAEASGAWSKNIVPLYLLTFHIYAEIEELLEFSPRVEQVSIHVQDIGHHTDHVVASMLPASKRQFPQQQCQRKK